MRIISGILKGKKILLPKDKLTRPLRDLVKESIFNVLKHSNKILISMENSNILDLFSGSGSFGLEAFSRGAKKITFVENYFLAFEILKKNINELKCQKFCEVLNQNCFDFIENIDTEYFSFDIIFMDPPYKEKKINKLLKSIIDKKILNNNGTIVIHRHKNENLDLPVELKVVEQKLYGISKITFCKL